MKNYFKHIATVALGVLALSACSPEEFEGVNEALVPQMSSYEDKIHIDVNQETNQVTFTMDEMKGLMPVWSFEEKSGKSYSTRNGLQRIYTVAGDYNVEVRVMNRNGISDGVVTKTFHINNTLIDFSKYYKMLAGTDGSREWRVKYDEQGHMGCGESGTDGLNWWSASPNDKKDWGVYDDRISFSADGKYTYNPGEGGTMYVNTGCSCYSEFNTNDGVDFMATVPVTTTTYTFEVVGEDLFIVLPAHTPFPYMPNDAFYESPRLKVESMSNTKMELLLVSDPGITWHITLTSEKDVEVFKGFKYNSEFNMYKTATKSFSSIWFADSNWNDAACQDFNANGVTMNEDGFQFTMPITNSSEWQGQVHIMTDLTLSVGTQYDFSCIVESSDNINRMTVKICPEGNDNDALWYKNDYKIEGGMGIIFFSGAEAPIDMVNTRVIFDFGGNNEGNDIKVSNIVLKRTVDDDGTVLPTDEPDEPVGGVVWADPESAANLLNSGTLSLASCWWANNDWEQIASPDVVIDGKNVTITAVEANGGQQWQGQVHLNSQVVIEEGKAYDFAITINASQDFGGVTVKPHPEGDDEHFFSEGRHDIAAFDDVKITYENVVANFSTDNLVITLDFPGCEAGTVFSVKNIIIQEHNEAAGGSWVGVDSADNLMTSGNFSLASCWWADNNWNQQSDPTVEINGRTATITANVTSGGSQWQGQVHFNTGVAIEEGVTYDFSITFNASQDLGGVTVKPHPEGIDDHFFSEGRHDIAAFDDVKVTYEDVVANFSTSNLVITLDFPGCETGTVIEVKDIIIQKH